MHMTCTWVSHDLNIDLHKLTGFLSSVGLATVDIAGIQKLGSFDLDALAEESPSDDFVAVVTKPEAEQYIKGAWLIVKY